MSAPAKPFGRRNLPAPATAPAAVAARPTVPPAFSDPDFCDPVSAEASEAILKMTAALTEERQKALLEKTAQGACVVPASGRAALLAGLVVACLHVSLDLGTAIALGQRLGTISVEGRTVPLVPLILAGSLWSGARSSAIVLFFIRALLSRLEMTHIGSYAVCGGLVAFLYAITMQALGWGDPSTLAVDVATGLAAGFFYRLFAGTRPA
jgi:hypothetical protein